MFRPVAVLGNIDLFSSRPRKACRSGDHLDVGPNCEWIPPAKKLGSFS
jgi:hypothetical protein